MNHLSDDIINSFIDGTLDAAGIKLLNEHTSNCSACAEKVTASSSLHSSLYKIKEYKPSNEFENKVMKIIMAGIKRKKEKNYFFAFVIGIFITSIALLFGLIAAGSLGEGNESSTSTINSLTDGFIQLLSPLQSVVNTQNLTFAGMIITLIIFISAYFFLDSHKAVKQRLSKVKH